MASKSPIDEELAKALELSDLESFDEARAILQRLSDGGCPEAMGVLGLMYFLGQGVARDACAAERLLEAAARAGVAGAAHNLGTLYTVGAPEMPPDRVKARHYYELARSLGFNSAPDSFYDEDD